MVGRLSRLLLLASLVALDAPDVGATTQVGVDAIAGEARRIDGADHEEDTLVARPGMREELEELTSKPDVDGKRLAEVMAKRIPMGSLVDEETKATVKKLETKGFKLLESDTRLSQLESQKPTGRTSEKELKDLRRKAADDRKAAGLLFEQALKLDPYSSNSLVQVGLRDKDAAYYREFMSNLIVYGCGSEPPSLLTRSYTTSTPPPPRSIARHLKLCPTPPLCLFAIIRVFSPSPSAAAPATSRQQSDAACWRAVESPTSTTCRTPPPPRGRAPPSSAPASARTARMKRAAPKASASVRSVSPGRSHHDS